MNYFITVFGSLISATESKGMKSVHAFPFVTLKIILLKRIESSLSITPTKEFKLIKEFLISSNPNP